MNPAALSPPAAAVISGSGLAVVPRGLTVEAEEEYATIGWPTTGVAGHPNRLLRARTRSGGVVYLAFGRPHPYEGWSEPELARPIEDLAARGARLLVLTCAAGGLAATATPGSVVVVDAVVDLQTRPPDEGRLVAATAPPLAPRAVAAFRPHLPVARGRYAAVWGPQYETPAEAAWLAGLADVVGMSGAPELRAATRLGLDVIMLAALVNRAGHAVGHADLLQAGGRLSRGLRLGLARLLGLVRAPHDDPGDD